MNIKDLFRRKNETASPSGDERGAVPLRIEGVPEAPLTPEPDDAELAAQAVLEILTQKTQKARKRRGSRDNDKSKSRDNDITKHRDNDKPDDKPAGTAAYYHHLAAKIRQTREGQRLRVTRFLAFVEQELRKPRLPAYGPGSLGLLEAELYKRLDIIEREQGPLKRRWQHCLAQVTVRLMQAQQHGAADPHEPGDGGKGENHAADADAHKQTP